MTTEDQELTGKINAAALYFLSCNLDWEVIPYTGTKWMILRTPFTVGNDIKIFQDMRDTMALYKKKTDSRHFVFVYTAPKHIEVAHLDGYTGYLFFVERLK